RFPVTIQSAPLASIGKTLNINQTAPVSFIWDVGVAGASTGNALADVVQGLILPDVSESA
ncbi:MAG TPA: hypothetical protein VGI25_01600, partial [Candidatus Udaeobacter sp.]